MVTIKDNDLYVVGIGASAGGLDAIQQLFDHIPDNTGMAFVIIQHLSPDFKSLMPELLAKHTKMEIFTAEDKLTIKPNCIYLNQRNKNLHIKGQELYLLDKGPKHNLNLPIDIFFHTLGEEFKEKSIGIILSGTGSDGSRGIKTIKEAGGTIIVQDPTTAQFDGMPNSSISTNLVDFILSPEKIAETLSKYPGNRLMLSVDNNAVKSNDVVFFNILEEVHKSSGIDFREYKRNTLLRRLEKRMNINNFDRLYDYLTFLKSNSDEKESLKQDFLIGVTSFFRDVEAFDSLKKNVIPEIFKNRKNTDPVRVWVSGCSTGEEVFSIAILLDDYIRKNKLNIDYKIFATDVDAQALSSAGNGSFHINISNELEKFYLENYFVKTGDKIEIIKRIREKIVFSNHNILKDPPFIRMDLISCRNMLIYLENKVQRKILLNFQFALNKYGYLFLGNSESLGETAKFFKNIDSKWKIFQNITDTKHIPSQNNPTDKINTITYRNPASSVIKPEFRYKENPETEFHKYLSNKHSPASIFIDKDFNILFIQGDVNKRLSFSQGVFQNNLLKAVNSEVAAIIRNGIRRLEHEKKDIIIKDIVSKTKEGTYYFDLSFHKAYAFENYKAIYLVQFSDDKEAADNKGIVIKNIPIDEISKQRVEDLENNLKSVRTELQNTVEELETSNEELQSSNEELMASNEELQSTNEELQSVNEELYTVNSELQEKNKELLYLNNDVTNLLNSTEIGTLFLDAELRIRKYTPSLHKHFNLQEADIGRPISSFAANFSEKIRLSIINDSKKALDKLIIIEKEIIDNEGNYYLKRISPFITSDKKIDGVVITFVDINKLKQTESDLIESETKYQKLFENLNEGFVHAYIITNRKGKPIDWEYISVNPAFEKQIGVSAQNLVGKRNSNLMTKVFEDTNKWISIFSKTAQNGNEQFIENYFKELDRYFIIHIFCPKNGEFAATFTDITEIKQKEEQLGIANERFELASEAAGVAFWEWYPKSNKTIGNNKWSELFGFKEEDKMASNWINNLDQEYSKTIPTILESHLKKEIELFDVEFKYNHPILKKTIWIHSKGKVVARDENGKPIKMTGVSIDITSRKSSEKKIIQFQKAFDSSSDAIGLSTTSGKHIYQNKAFTDLFGYDVSEFSNKSERALYEDKKTANKIFKTIISGKSWSGDVNMVSKSGRVFPVNLRADAILDESGKVIGLIGIHRDISKKVAQEKLKEEQHLKTLTMFDAINEVVYVADPNTYELVYTNNKFNEIWGTDSTPVGKKCHEVLQCKDLPCEFCTNDIIFNQRPNETYVWEFQNIANGKWYRCSDRAIDWVDGRKLRMEIAIDITEEKTARDKIVSSEERFRNLFEGSPLGKSITSVDGKLKVNKMFSRMIGYSEEELNKMDWKDITHPDDIQVGIDAIAKMKESNNPVSFRKRYIHKNGDIVWTDVRSIAYFDKINKTKYYLTSISDITELVNFENALIKSEERYRLATTASDSGIWDWWVDSDDVYFSDQWKAQLGYLPDELENKFDTWIQLLHPDCKERAIKSVQDFLVKPQDYFILEFRMIHKDGKPRWIYSRAAAVRDKKGKVIRMFGSHYDITKRKEAEDLLIRNEEQLQKVQKIAKIGSWFFTPETNEVIWSKELYQLFDLDSSLPPPSFEEQKHFYTTESWELLSDAYSKTAEKGTPYELELTTIKKDGTNGWLWARGEAIKDKKGRITFLWGAFQEISHYKETEKQLLNAKKKAELANFHKNYFLANMSHEIRTPMNGVIGFSNLLKDDDLHPEDKHRYINIIDGNANQLLNLIDDIIDVAKIEAGEITIAKKECNLGDMLFELELNFNEIKNNRNKSEIKFSKIIPEEHKDIVIVTDPLRLRQVLSNLLNNSMKFTDKGSINFGYAVNDSDIEFFVADEGIGIPADKIDEIFERFKQLNYENAATYGGTGLGLAICKGIVNLLGGDISVKSKLGKGTVFKFTVPRFEVKKARVAITRDENEIGLGFISDLTILIAEDDDIVQLYFTEIFRSYGTKLLFASNGLQAVDLYRKNPEIDVVLMDLRMPLMNGFKAISKIMEINQKANIIVQTAYVMPEEREKCMSIGCKGYLLKPIAKNELFNTIKRIVKSKKNI